MRLRALFHSILLVTMASGLAHAEGEYEDPTLDWLPQDVDWREAEVVRIEFGDHVFTPDDLKLRQNKPYKLVFDNISSRHAHDLIDPGFFHAVVLGKLRAGGVTINTPHIHNAKLRPNSEVMLYLIPIKPGEYEIFCSIPGHRDDGMEGYITIVPEEGTGV